MCEKDVVHEGNVRSFPPSLEAVLGQAVRWYDERAALEQLIARSAGYVNGSAERNQEDRDESDRAGGALLLEIMEEMENAWGFASKQKDGNQ